MNQDLKAQIRRYFEQKEYFEATTAILRMNITEQDMSDELLDSFEKRVRLRIYCLLPTWCRERGWAIVERRAKTDPDELFRGMLERIVHRGKEEWIKLGLRVAGGRTRVAHRPWEPPPPEQRGE
jgi:hypothetical protein